ncbi:toprim domain-containing protein [Candidatus Woesearchaeota archaeon]|nr:MAG: toprim domain-containing protein [Candidatus Woesearchaeota archaeon]
MKTTRNELALFLEKLRTTRKKIIVEGHNDAKSLEQLGVSAHLIYELDTALELFAERFAHEEVILLVDLDKEGKKIYAKLRNALIRNGAKVDNYFREWLFKNTDVRQVETLAGYVEKQRYSYFSLRSR